MSTIDYAASVRTLLELVAAERPDTLPELVDLLGRSSARGAFAELMTMWGAETAHEVVAIVLKASADLSRLERWRIVPWQNLKERLDGPNLPALCDVARKRAVRTSIVRKKQRREMIANRLEKLVQIEQKRQELDAWLAEPSAPIAPERLARILRRPRR